MNYCITLELTTNIHATDPKCATCADGSTAVQTYCPVPNCATPAANAWECDICATNYARSFDKKHCYDISTG